MSNPVHVCDCPSTVVDTFVGSGAIEFPSIEIFEPFKEY
jgi:hypothetical protein